MTTEIKFKDARPGDLYWSMSDGDWHIIRTVEYLPHPTLGDTYHLTCVGTLNPVVAAGAPNATLGQ
jgi:hypothetical protein